ENADQKENTIRRKRDEKNGDDGKSDQQRSRPLQPETKSAFGFGGHRKYSSAIRAIESLAAFFVLVRYCLAVGMSGDCGGGVMGARAALSFSVICGSGPSSAMAST